MFIEIEGENFVEEKLNFNWHLMDQYLEQIKIAQKRYQMTGEMPMTFISKLPELYTIEKRVVQPEGLSTSVLECTEEACHQVQAIRKQEGEFLITDCSDRMEKIRETILFIQNRQQTVIKEYQKRIQVRIKKHLNDEITMDQARLAQEIALLAEKGDITEEIIRLQSHLEHYFKVIHHEEPIGRTINFIVQEMQREINTIGAKSLDSKINRSVVLIRGNIEKIREQVQNIE